MNEDTIFYVYVDWTTEENPRAFYVGKGKKIRVGQVERNRYWKNIRNKYGWKREVILSTNDEAYAFEQEIFYISEHKTFRKDWPKNIGWGANLTRGGEGPSGHKHSQKTCQQMSKSRTGLKRDPKGCQNIALGKMGSKNPMWGKPLSEEHRRKQSEANKGKRNGGSFPKGHSLQVGEKHAQAKLTTEDVIQIKQLIVDGLSCKLIGPMFGVARQTISQIKFEGSWTHIPWATQKSPPDANHAQETPNLEPRPQKLPFGGDKNPKSILDDEKVIQIKQMIRDGKTNTELATLFGVHKNTIGAIRHGRSWKHIP